MKQILSYYILLLPLFTGLAQGTNEFQIKSVEEVNISKNILLEEFTGVWCGCCPKGHIVVESILEDHPGVIPVLIHSGSAEEPMATHDGDQLSVDLNVWFPSASIDRYVFDGMETSLFSETYWQEMVTERLKQTIKAEVSIEKSFDNSTRQLELTVTVEFIKAEKGDFRFNAYILEDNLIFDQANNYDADPSHPDLFGRGDPIVGYVHDHVLRKMLDGPYGITPDDGSGIPETVRAGEVYTHSFTTTLDPDFKIEDIQLVAYIMDYDDQYGSEVLNAVSMPLLSTSVGSKEVDETFLVYPNPSTGTFNVIYGSVSPDKIWLAVRNLQGQILYQQEWNKGVGEQFVSFSLDMLADGIYFLELSDGDGVRYERVVVH